MRQMRNGTNLEGKEGATRSRRSSDSGRQHRRWHGAAPFVGDVAIGGDAIAEVGIDAEEHIVTPGFVDLHTHFDARAGWDPLLTPVSWHGVTTTFAPCKPADREFLAGMMETVEGIRRTPSSLACRGIGTAKAIDLQKLSPSAARNRRRENA